MRTSKYHQQKVESGEWYTTQWHFDHWKEEFEKKYKAHNINYLIKSVDFVYDRAFLFDDGKYFNVVKDSSKKFIYAEVDKKEDILSLRGQAYDFEKKQINTIIKDLEYCIQAIGRICRCRNKNKDIYIFSDKEIVERIQIGYDKSKIGLMNAEFRALLSMDLKKENISSKIVEYSQQSKKAYTTIKYAAYTVRNSIKNIAAWQYLRDYVLKNPTTENPEWQFKQLYLEFDEAYSGYSYVQNSKYDFEKIIMDIRYDMDQVSEASCDLPTILSFHYIDKLFEEKGYCKKFKPAHFLMSPSLFKQVYLGALGEVVGECILKHELGWDLEELDDVSYYEYFDFKLGNIYFDFKHWKRCGRAIQKE